MIKALRDQLSRGSAATAFAILTVLAPRASPQCDAGELSAGAGAAGDAIGASVAIWGDMALLGAPFGELAGVPTGTVHSFERVGASWVAAGTLSAGDGSADDRFGGAIAIHENLLVVGAQQHDGLGIDSGAAYVFERSGPTWNQVAKLTASDAAAGDSFGRSVAIWDGTVVVGASRADAGASDSGAVYVFEKSGAAWPETAKLTASSAAPGDFLGTSVSIQDGVLAAGGSAFDIPGGRAFVFERSIQGTWGPNEVAELIASAGSPTFRFGFAIANSDQRVLVGDPLDNPSNFGSGAVYVFERTGPGAWTNQETTKLTVNHGQETLELGSSLALDDRRLLVGAFETHGASGMAHVFEEGLAGWNRIATYRSPEPTPSDTFGLAVSLFGDTALVGAPGGNGPIAGSGTAFGFPVLGFADAYCFCGGGAPCGNESGAGGCINSTGRGALLNVCGSNSVLADDLVLQCSELPTGVLGLVYMGPSQAQVPFGDGQRCVAAGGAGLFRFSVQSSGANGVIAEGPGLVAHSQASFPAAGQIASGATWNFQTWFRDPSGACGSGANLSNAMQVTFGP